MGHTRSRHYNRYTLEYKLQAVKLANQHMKPVTPSPKRRSSRSDPLRQKQDELEKANKRIARLEPKHESQRHPIDNAIVESFFHSMKNEAVQRKVYRNEIEAMSEIIMYINFYNQERLHSSLGYQSPLNYEKLCA